MMRSSRSAERGQLVGQVPFNLPARFFLGRFLFGHYLLGHNLPGQFPSAETRQDQSVHRRCTRRGWTLIEMLITLSVMGTITVVAVKTLGAMLRAEYTGVEHVARLMTTSRMARQFRADVHAASKVEIAPDLPTKPLLVVTIDDTRQIQYETHASGLLRTDLRANLAPIKELWRLKQASFQCVETSGPPRIVTLVVRTVVTEPGVTSASGATHRELRFDAVISRDRN